MDNSTINSISSGCISTDASHKEHSCTQNWSTSVELFLYLLTHVHKTVYFLIKNMPHCDHQFPACGLGLGIWGKCNPFLSHRTVLLETKRWGYLLNSEYQILQNSGDSVQHISSSSHFFPTPSAHSQSLHARHPRRCSEKFLSCQEKMYIYSANIWKTSGLQKIWHLPFLKYPQPRGRTLGSHTHSTIYMPASKCSQIIESEKILGHVWYI